MLRRTLSHPLLLLLVGALVSALFVPVFTQRWQDHQRRLDMQTSLVTEMTRSSTGFMTVVRLRLEDPTRREADLGEAWRQWQTESAVVRAKLRAFYPGDGLVDEWEAVRVALSGFNSRALFAGTVDDPQTDLEGFLEIVNTSLGSRAADEYGAIVAVDAAVDQLVARVLETAPKVS